MLQGVDSAGRDRETMRSHPLRRLFVWTATVALVSSGCYAAFAGQTSAAKKTQNPKETLPPSLSAEIRHQILLLPFYSVFDSINFTLEGRQATLTGQVVRRTLKENAEAAVKSIDGVDTVVNLIEVLPVSTSDDDLRNAIYRSLYEDSSLAHYAIQNVPPIHIIVKNGSVALEGFVETNSDKALAGTRASSIPKVLGVKNNLVVRAKGSTAE